MDGRTEQALLHPAQPLAPGEAAVYPQPAQR